MLLLLLLLVPVLLRPLLPLLRLLPPTQTRCEAPREVEDDPGEGEGDGDGLTPQSAVFVGGGTTVFRQLPRVTATAAPVINSGTTGELFRRRAATMGWRVGPCCCVFGSAGVFTRGGGLVGKERRIHTIRAPLLLARSASRSRQRVGGDGGETLRARRFQWPLLVPLTPLRINAPATTSAPPTHWRQPSGSRKKSAASAMVKTTLSLSTGATREAGPSCSARK